MLRFSFFLILTAFFVLISLKVTKQDHEYYNHFIVKKMNQKKVELHQTRNLIQKHIWFSQDGQRKQCLLTCDKSYFTFSQKNKKADELLYNIRGWYQEDIAENSQKLRYFTSNEGIYSFMPHQFVSKEVHMSFLDECGINLPTTCNPDNVYMRAKVKKILFNLKEEGASFSASHIKATFPKLKKENVKSKTIN